LHVYRGYALNSWTKDCFRCSYLAV